MAGLGLVMVTFLQLLLMVPGLKTPHMGHQPATVTPPIRMPFGSYDYFGHTKWGELGPISSDARQAQSLHQAGKLTQCESVLWKRFISAPTDLTALQGLVSVNRQLSRSGVLLERIAQRADQRAPTLTAKSIVFAYQYCLAMLSEARNCGETGATFDAGNNKTSAGWVYGFFQSNTSVFDAKDRINSILYVSLLLGQGLDLEARRAAQKALKVDPKFYQLRAVYAHSLARDTVAIAKSDGKWTKAPPEERMNIDEAFRQSKIVIQQAPQWPVGYYLAGFFGREKNKKEALQYLKKYLEIGPKGTKRYMDSEAMLAELKRAK